MSKWTRSKWLYLTLLMVLLLACNVTAPSGQVATEVAATLAAAQGATSTAVQAATDSAAQIETAVAATSAGQAATLGVDQAVALTLTALAPAPTASEAAAPEATASPAPTPTAQVIVVTQPPQPTDTLPPPAPTQTQPPPSPTVEPTHGAKSSDFEILESDGAVSAAIVIYPGQFLLVEADGKIWAGVAFTGENGPNGWDNTDCNPKFPKPCAHPYSLLMTYDTAVSWIEVGERYSQHYTGPPAGLIFMINDDIPGNGSGQFNVHVWIGSAVPAP
jgi:hypothetical protein